MVNKLWAMFLDLLTLLSHSKESRLFLVGNFEIFEISLPNRRLMSLGLQSANSPAVLRIPCQVSGAGAIIYTNVAFNSMAIRSDTEIAYDCRFIAVQLVLRVTIYLPGSLKRTLAFCLRHALVAHGTEVFE